MIALAFRTHTLTVERASRASDGQGGWVTTFASIGEATGSLQPGSAREGEAADAERALARWTFYTDTDADVRRDDELVGARRFTVLATSAWEAGTRLDHLTVDLEEVQRGS